MAGRLKQGLLVLAVVCAAVAAGAPGASARPAVARAATGSCMGGTVPAVVDETFICLSVGGPCAASFQQDYAKFGFSCSRGRITKVTPVSGPLLADAFLNTKNTDVSTRMTKFVHAGPTPVLHLTFKVPLKGTHRLTVQVVNGRTDASSSVNYTLQSGWQFTYEVLPPLAASAAPGAYRVAITIDGKGRRQLYYTVS